MVAMASHALSTKATRAALRGVWRFGYWIALFMSILTIATFAIAFATPPRSGPFCTMSACVTAPYTDVAAFFPRDYVWMYPALLLKVAVISIDWIVLIISSALLSIVFKRAGRDEIS
jgi:hypothetical protein